MTTYFEDIVNVTLLENAEYIDDNNYRLILNNEEINQQGTLVLVDMYPSHSFVTGFLLTTINHTNIDSTTPTHFFIEFKDDVTTFKFDFQNNSVNCALTITMENYQTDHFEIYPIYSGTHPSFYNAIDMTFEIKLLNGFLWLYVNNTTWIEKLDMDEHPLSLESGSIQYTATCTTEIISHEIKNIYFEPIMVFSDDVYFEKSIYAEKIEGLEDNLVLCEEDVKISIPTASIVSYIGNSYIDDPTFKNILGRTVNRDDYIELANQIGIPKSQTTFRVTNPSGWNFQGDYIQVGSTITPNLYEKGGYLHKNIPIVTATDDLNNPYGISLWMYTQNTQKAGLAWTIGGKTSFGIQSILSPEGDRTALIENLYPNTTETWERMTIRHLTGNIGIGTTNPTAKLEVAGDIKATRYFGIDYNDLNNKPIIPAAQVNADWNAVSGAAEIFNKPSNLANLNQIIGVFIVDRWLIRTSPADNNWQSVVWSPELSIFVAIASSGTGNRVMTSPDGFTWTIRTSAADNNWRSLCWSPQLSLFVAVGYPFATNRIMTSTNGINWSLQVVPFNQSWTSVCWSPELSLFVAVADFTAALPNQVMTSTNGTTWIARTAPTTNNWRSVCWSPELSLFVVVGDSGVGNRVMTSTNGTSWTIGATPVDNNWHHVCWSPELYLFVAVAYTGTNNRIMTSPDGFAWTIRTSPANNGWRETVWVRELSLFVAISDSGVGNRIMTSADGIHWVTRQSPIDNAWITVCWSPKLSMFVATSYTGTGNRIMSTTFGLPQL